MCSREPRMLSASPEKMSWLLSGKATKLTSRQPEGLLAEDKHTNTCMLIRQGEGGVMARAATNKT